MSRRQDDDWDEPDYVKVHNKMMKDHYGGNLNAPTTSNNIDTETNFMCDEYPHCGLSGWSCHLLQSIVYEESATNRRPMAREVREDMADTIKSLIAADRNKLIKHLAFQLGEDEEHLRALAENIGSAPPAL